MNLAWMLGVALASIGAQVAPAPGGLTVEQAVALGLERAQSVKIAEGRLSQARQQTRSALGLLGFRVDTQATYERYNEGQPFGGGGRGPLDSKSAAVAVSYPVDIVGAGRRAARAASLNEEAAREGVESERIQVKRRVRDAYFGALGADWGLQVQREFVTAAEQRLEVVRRRFNAGDVARFDVLRLETDLQRFLSARTEAENNLRLAKQVLNNALARPVETEFEMVSPFKEARSADLPEYDLSPAALHALAERSRPELRQLASLIRAREFVTFATRAGTLPNLNLQALFVRAFDPSPFQRENSVTLRASLSYAIFDSGVTRANVLAAREEERILAEQLSQARQAISLEVESAIVRLRNARSQVEFAEKTVELQTEALRLSELRFNEGEGILLDVTSANADLRAALGALVAARTQYLQGVAALQAAVGTDALPRSPEVTS